VVQGGVLTGTSCAIFIVLNLNLISLFTLTKKNTSQTIPMSQLVPAMLLTLLLISPVYAVDPYEGLCTSEQDFNTTATAIFACVGSDAQACNDAGGEFDREDGEADGQCDGFATPDKCGGLTGFTYVPDMTCEEVGSYLSDPGNTLSVCLNPAYRMMIPQVQSNCCGGEDNHKDICADLPDPYVAICTSEQDFKTNATATYACKGTNADACTDAGGMFNDDEETCEGIDLPYICGLITGFNYEEDKTCGQMGYDLFNPDAAYNLVDCANPYILPFIYQLQSTCCGGAENHKDICPDNPKPYEAICTSEDDFLTNAKSSSHCRGINADACTAAGGEYKNNEQNCYL